jgi:hypothetical protein
MPKLIINISSEGTMPCSLPDFYVMISRVRSFEGLRLKERDGVAMDKLLQLKPNEYLHAYENGHDKDWDGTRAWAALIALRRDRLKAATERAEEKAAEKVAKKARAAALRKTAAAKSAKAKKENKEKTAAAAAAARERVAEKQPSAKRHKGSRPATLQARVSTLPSVVTLATVTVGGATGEEAGDKAGSEGARGTEGTTGAAAGLGGAAAPNPLNGFDGERGHGGHGAQSCSAGLKNNHLFN